MKNQFKISLNHSEEGTNFNIYVGKDISNSFNWKTVLKIFATVALCILALLGKIDWEVIIEILKQIVDKI